MKLTIEKLGRIKKAEIDLRPLTVFIGPNNTNKTWTAYALYGALQALSGTKTSAFQTKWRGGNAEFHNRLKAQLGTLFNVLTLDSAPENVECTFAIPPLFEGIPGLWPFEIERNLLSQILGLPEQNLPEARVHLEAMPNEFETTLHTAKVTFEAQQNRVTMNVRYQNGAEGSEKTYISSGELWTQESIFDFVYGRIWRFITNVIVFPAERNGLLSTWSWLPPSSRFNMALPVLDFAHFLQAAQGVSPKGAPLLSEMLRRIVGGEIAYVENAKGIKGLVFRNASGLELPLTAAASLNRAVAGLAIYLERFSHLGDVLIIDELEMNAHPEAQLALTELVAALVNMGIRVVFTTHSPYIVDHLNNLMEAFRVRPMQQAELAKKFALRTIASFISPEKVAVHAFEEDPSAGEVVVREVLNRESGLIDWSTFSRVSERIANLYSDILSAAEDKS